MGLSCVLHMGLRCMVTACAIVLESDGHSSLGLTGKLGASDKFGKLLCIAGI